MPILGRLDSLPDEDDSDTSRVLVPLCQLDPIQLQLLQLANAGKNSIETKLGLNDSSQIVLDIINLAKKAKSRRNECRYIADQAFLLVNAVDGGVKGRALDVNIILRDHIVRLNEDLGQIRRIIKGFASWWILFRNAQSLRGLEKCHDILNHEMDLYLLLLRCSLAQPSRRRVKKGRRFSSQMAPTAPPPAQQHPPPPTLTKAKRRTYPYPAPRSAAAPFPSTSTPTAAVHWNRQTHHARTPFIAGAF